jgi:hypothetical protein
MGAVTGAGVMGVRMAVVGIVTFVVVVAVIAVRADLVVAVAWISVAVAPTVAVVVAMIPTAAPSTARLGGILGDAHVVVAVYAVGADVTVAAIRHPMVDVAAIAGAGASVGTGTGMTVVIVVVGTPAIGVASAAQVGLGTT